MEGNSLAVDAIKMLSSLLKKVKSAVPLFKALRAENLFKSNKPKV
jgi:hypothetical protein